MDLPDSHSFPFPSQYDATKTALKVCSVRGCREFVALDAQHKMCEECRSRHRIYATTKRARRRIEKAAVMAKYSGETTILPSRGADAGNATSMDAHTFATVTLPADQLVNEAGGPPVLENSQIDPSLLSEPSQGVLLPAMHNPASALVPQSYLNSSLELVGAPKPVSSCAQSKEEFTPEPDHDQSLLVSNLTEHCASYFEPVQKNGDNSSVGSPTDPSRYCSVKGCKLQIPVSYRYKMCPSCRTRYQRYGSTKRAKWKAEREVFDRELIGLRVQEDERRQQAGERSLVDSPEELRLWELSILKQTEPPPVDPSRVPLDETGTENTSDDHMLDSKGEPSSLGNFPLTLIEPTTALDSPYARSPYTIPQDQALPIRMCSVSHCHRILPGFYRYKRCEEHRLQNRYHSHLKRLREKVFKGISQDPGALLTTLNLQESCLKVPLDQWAERDQDDLQIDLKQDSKEADGREPSESKEKIKQNKRNFVCATIDCQNLLLPNVRWKNCDYCRAYERVYKKQRKEIVQNAVREAERLKEVVGQMRLDDTTIPTKPLEVTAAAEEKINAQEHPQPSKNNNAMSSSLHDNLPHNAVDDDVSGSGSRGLDEVAPLTSPIHPLSPAPTSLDDATTTADLPPAAASLTVVSSTTQAPGMFRSVLRPASDANSTPPPISGTTTFEPLANSNKSSTSKAPTDGALSLVFREYQPKVASTETSRRASSPVIHVYKDLVSPQNIKKNIGLVGASSYHVYRSKMPLPSSAHNFPDPLAKACRSFDKRLRTEELQTKGARPQDNTKETLKLSSQQLPAPSIVSALSTSATANKVTPGANEDADTPTSTPEIQNAEVQEQPGDVVPSVAHKQQNAHSMQPLAPVPSPAAGNTPTSLTPASLYPLSYPYSYHVLQTYGRSPYAASSPTLVEPISMAYPSLHSPHHFPYHGFYPSTLPYPYFTSRYHANPFQLPPLPQLSLHVHPYPPLQSLPTSSEISGTSLPASACRPETIIETKSLSSKRKGKDAEHDTCISSNKIITREVALPPLPEPPKDLACTKENNAGSNPTFDKERGLTRLGSSIGRCGNKSCNRVIPGDLDGKFCDKCRLRMKKHRAKVRQRLKLEPRKSILVSVIGGQPRVIR